MLSELIRKCRSYRKYHQEVPIAESDLLEMIENARLSASARNYQSLKYILSNSSQTNELIFFNLAWGGYLKNWKGPAEGERPSAYIVMLNDSQITNNYYCDHGIAAQNILLTAVEKGFGGCLVASINREKLRDDLSIPAQYDIIQVLALGKPKEVVVIEPLGSDGDIRYWRDCNQVHHVPKRSLKDIILRF